ncbi:hypothetical protein ACQ4PT_010389 [Festuca glaucescens]
MQGVTSHAPSSLSPSGSGCSTTSLAAQPHDSVEVGARVGRAYGEWAGEGEVRADAALGGAGVGAHGDEQRVVLVFYGVVGRRVQQPPPKHSRHHIRCGALGLKPPYQEVHAIDPHPSPDTAQTQLDGDEDGDYKHLTVESCRIYNHVFKEFTVIDT